MSTTLHSAQGEIYEKPSRAGDLFPGTSSNTKGKSKDKGSEKSEDKGSKKSRDKASEKSKGKESDKSSATGENSNQKKAYDYLSHSWYNRLQ